MLDADTLAHLAGSRFQDIDGYSVSRLEILLELLMRRKSDESAVEHHMAFLLGRLDDLIPIVVGAREIRCREHGGTGRQPKQGRAARDELGAIPIDRRHLFYSAAC